MAYQEIKRLTGVDPSLAHRWVKEAMSVPADEADVMRAVEDGRIAQLASRAERLYFRARSAEDDAESDEARASFQRNQALALTTALRIVESRRKLFGIDAPLKQEIDGPAPVTIVANEVPSPEDVARLVAAAFGGRAMTRDGSSGADSTVGAGGVPSKPAGQ